MVLICVNREASAHPMIARSSIFCVNILAVGTGRDRESCSPITRGVPIDSKVSRRGARRPVRPSSTVALRTSIAGLAEEHTAGTHTVFLGEVLDTGAIDGRPLGYVNGTYRDFGIDIP